MLNRRKRIFGYVQHSVGGGVVEHDPDHSLEDQMIIFVSQLEQVMSRIREKDPGLPPVQPLPLMAEMLNRIIAMCENLSRNTSSTQKLRMALPHLSDVFLRTSSVYPQLRILPRAGNRIIVEALIRHQRSKSIGNKHFSQFAQFAQFSGITDNELLCRRLCEGLAASMEIYFSYYESFFYWPAMQDRWRRIYKVFIDDLMITASEC